MTDIIQSLWIGDELSVMEQLSIVSFLVAGHEYHLYVYDDVANIPSGAILKDGSKVLPPSMIFQYDKYKTYSGFSNFFRYKLLLEKGGWWVDTDMVCIKPFDFTGDYVFSSESVRGVEYINTGAIKAPQGGQAMARAWETCLTKNTSELGWGEVGPRLMGEVVRGLMLEKCVMPYKTFCPIPYADWDKVLDPESHWEFDENTYAVHLWNELWRRGGKDKNQRYDPNCLYEKLKRTCLG